MLWTRPVGRGYSAPSVARGRLFLLDSQERRVRLACLRSETGEELWRTEYETDYQGHLEDGAGPVATPVVDGDRVYTFGIEGRLRCHHVLDGALVWEVDTAARFGVVQNLYGAGSTPWVEGDLLIAMIGGSPAGTPDIFSNQTQGNGSGIVAFDKYTGEVRYRVSDELASYSSPIVADVAGRRRGFAFTRGGLLVFRPGDGGIESFTPWHDPRRRGVNAMTPVVAGDTVFVSEAYGSGGSLLRIRPDGSQQEVWSDAPRSDDQRLAAHWATPVHHDGYLYGVSGRSSLEAELRCVRLATGEVTWKHAGLKLATLIYADGHLVVTTEFGRLLLVKARPDRYEAVADVNLFEQRPEYPWSQPVEPADDTPPVVRPLLRYPVWNAPVLARGLLYVRGWGRLVCFDLRRADRAAGASPSASR